ncbi:MAG: hypothetical protein ACRERC_14970, partial [Candidatus Binatia bacterium]
MDVGLAAGVGPVAPPGDGVAAVRGDADDRIDLGGGGAVVDRGRALERRAGGIVAAADDRGDRAGPGRRLAPHDDEVAGRVGADVGGVGVLDGRPVDAKVARRRLAERIEAPPEHGVVGPGVTVALPD